MTEDDIRRIFRQEIERYIREQTDTARRTGESEERQTEVDGQIPPDETDDSSADVSEVDEDQESQQEMSEPEDIQLPVQPIQFQSTEGIDYDELISKYRQEDTSQLDVEEVDVDQDAQKSARVGKSQFKASPLPESSEPIGPESGGASNLELRTLDLDQYVEDVQEVDQDRQTSDQFPQRPPDESAIDVEEVSRDFSDPGQGSSAAGDSPSTSQHVEVTHKIELVVTPSDDLAQQMVDKLLPAVVDMIDDLQSRLHEETGHAISLLESGRTLT